MPRRRVVQRRQTEPDARYHDRLVGKMINLVMRKGKKSISESICYRAFEMVQQKTGSEPLKLFRAAVDNVKPVVEVKSRRVGGASYQIPVDVRPERRISLALRWIIQYADQRTGKSMEEKLAAELIDAANKTGAAIKKKEDTHRMAEANKAFAHFRW
ncbi:MAG TPA: 30S ribosomal protein S7 [Nitrospiria bacterium]|nr:30S ribosomal protein S7 [Nitrospiria bacterium]